MAAGAHPPVPDPPAWAAGALYVRPGDAPLPFWTEYAPFLWGADVNYDSDGDARDPRRPYLWSDLDIFHRGTRERLRVFRADRGIGLWVWGDDPRSVRAAAYLTALRTQGAVFALDAAGGAELPLPGLAALIPDLERRLADAEACRTP